MGRNKLELNLASVLLIQKISGSSHVSIWVGGFPKEAGLQLSILPEQAFEAMVREISPPRAFGFLVVAPSEALCQGNDHPYYGLTISHISYCSALYLGLL